MSSSAFHPPNAADPFDTPKLETGYLTDAAGADLATLRCGVARYRSRSRGLRHRCMPAWQCAHEAQPGCARCRRQPEAWRRLCGLHRMFPACSRRPTVAASPPQRRSSCAAPNHLRIRAAPQGRRALGT